MTHHAYCLDNLSEHTAKKLEPWTIDPKTFSYPDAPFKDASSYKKWACTQGTKYCAFSLVEGEVSTNRVTKDNEPKRIFGMVADYDTETPFTEEQIKEFVARSVASDHPCAYLSKSYRGGLHVVWLFESPVSCLGRLSATQFLKEASKGLGLIKLLRGLDTKAVETPEQYYLYGRDWQVVSNHTIPDAVTHLWMHQCTKSDTFKNYGIEVPLDVVWEEVQTKFPNHGWRGDFKEGARGPTFFDPHGGHQSDNSAVVKPTGMQAFNMDKGFFSWAEIFGTGFVRKFQESRIGGSVANFYYDSSNYWEKVEKRFLPRNRKDVEVRLKAVHRLNGRTPKNDTFSEIDDAFSTIITAKSVSAAMPLVFNKNEVVEIAGRRYLNIATREPIKPADAQQQWKTNFPFIGELVESVYGPDQLPYWLAWMARFYRSAHLGVPEQGHAVFLIGDTGAGKTLINENVLDIMFGGHASCSAFLMGEDGSRFNAPLFEYGVWTCDDRVPASDARKFQHYSSTVKSIVANGMFHVDDKNRRSGQIPWNGRLSVTANFTQEDIRMVPDLNVSMRDKIMLFKAQNHSFAFGSRAENREACQKEAPFFARWLLDHTPPSQIMGSQRFGVSSYINPELEAFALENSSHAYMLEIVEIFNDQHFSAQGSPDWTGTATELMRELGTYEGHNVFLKGVDAIRIGRSLAHYNNKKVDWLDKKGKKWVIHNPFLKKNNG